MNPVVERNAASARKALEARLRKQTPKNLYGFNATLLASKMVKGAMKDVGYPQTAGTVKVVADRGKATNWRWHFKIEGPK